MADSGPPTQKSTFVNKHHEAVSSMYAQIRAGDFGERRRRKKKTNGFLKDR
jgi:hypothetical protein